MKPQASGRANAKAAGAPPFDGPCGWGCLWISDDICGHCQFGDSMGVGIGSSLEDFEHRNGEQMKVEHIGTAIGTALDPLMT